MALASTLPTYAVDWRVEYPPNLCRRFSACAHITYRVRFSFGGGEEQLNFLPFEMCAASQSYREGGREARKTNPSETLHTIWRMPAEGDGGGRAGGLVTHFHHAYLVLLILLLRSHLPAMCNVYVRVRLAAEEMRSQNNICRITAMRASEHSCFSPDRPTDRPRPTVPSFHHPTTPMLSSSSDRANDRKYILLLLPDCRSCTSLGLRRT